MEYIKHRGVFIPLIGFGTWRLGFNPNNYEDELQTMLYGMNNYEMKLIDYAEMYENKYNSKIIADAISSYGREKLFIVNKILPKNIKNGKHIETCKKSLNAIKIDYFDLYLLHWKEDVDLQDMVNKMEELVELGLIKRWGVSNFDVNEMEELFKCNKGSNCFCNQILYNIKARGPEYSLIPWCKAHDVLIIAYSPLFNSTEEREKITTNEKVVSIAKAENKTPESLMISFVIRNRDIVTIFKTSNIMHLKGNMKNVFDPISNEDLRKIDNIYPEPKKKQRLMKI